MIHKVTFARPDYVLPEERKPVALNVFVNQRHYAVLRYNGMKYVGCLPTHDGLVISGEYSLREWKAKASEINRAAVKFDASLTVTSILNERILVAKSHQMDFFESIGQLPGDIQFLTSAAKEKVLEQYAEWLEENQIIPSF